MARPRPELDLRVEANTPQQARHRSMADSAKWGAVAHQAGLRLD